MPAHARAEEVAGRIAQDEFAFRALSVAANLGERATRSEANVHDIPGSSVGTPFSAYECKRDRERRGRGGGEAITRGRSKSIRAGIKRGQVYALI